MAKRRKAIPRLAEGELEILQMLWRENAVTILEAQKALGLPIGYTTVQTRLNRLAKKGLVKKTTDRPGRYTASVTPEEVHAKDLDTLVERVSGGRVTPLVAHLINHESVSAEEIRELKALIKEAERRTRKSQSREAK
ncbi:MAG: BlaI/MecI/CopY family transcriptional regulator [Planctomycetes bacterium]|nr:BlaI/MecI/CopY family transcriptional regulator [Planctomycetota bacterium]